MNAMGMILQAPPTTEVKGNLNKNAAKASEGTVSFPSLLKKGEIEQGQAQALLSAAVQTSNALIPATGEIKVELQSFLEAMNLQPSDLLGMVEETVDNPNNELAASLLGLITNNQQDTTESLDSELSVQALDATMGIHLNQEELEKLEQQLTAILAKLENLLATVSTEEDSKKIAPKMLELLQQLTKLEAKLAGTNPTSDVVNRSINLDLEQYPALKEIIVAFQNRSNLSAKQLYNSDSQVTTKDVAKWIENAIRNQQVSEAAGTTGQTTAVEQEVPGLQDATKVSTNVNQPVQQATFQTNTALPKLEQFVIYVNQNQSSQSVEQQVMDQFQQVMKSSKFMTTPNGLNQLSIALRPDNLGEMMIRLTQINGEMTVKILVTSQAAKDMLESNMNQLKHMFSPQQVVIERQDVISGQTQNPTKQNDEQSLNSQQQGQSDHSEQQEKNHSEEDFQSQLNEMILNEKV
ncbi:flagellar hook-length control protein FliK [Ornithinibacillus contaminans]|uniref:flagellar hook-length control protein FliK n=1 Tax=Ornithinibacillus contaminans TaxID=694055 RepID=UPI00064DE624|nr:flagellar hook-length control protein FliK [Ornithinibacillus contaminans]